MLVKDNKKFVKKTSGFTNMKNNNQNKSVEQKINVRFN